MKILSLYTSLPSSVDFPATVVRLVLSVVESQVFSRKCFVTASWSAVGLATFLILVLPAS